MKKRSGIRFICLAATVFLFLIGTSVQAFQSTFDTNAEGWTAVNDYKDFQQVATGGNPDGFIKATDRGDGRTWYFVAPASWSGNLSSYIGGTLAYDIKLISGSAYFNNAEVIIYGAGTSVSWDIDAKPASGVWTPHSVDLNYTNFGVNQATFNNVMSSVSAIWIRGEYISGGDSEGLDNVIMTAAPVPLPLPILLLGSGLAGLAAMKKRWVKRM